MQHNTRELVRETAFSMIINGEKPIIDFFNLQRLIYKSVANTSLYCCGV
jgi:hypothetical protein